MNLVSSLRWLDTKTASAGRGDKTTGDELAAGSSISATVAIAGEVRMIAFSAVSVANIETVDIALHKRQTLKLRVLVVTLNSFLVPASYAIDVDLVDSKHGTRQGIIWIE